MILARLGTTPPANSPLAALLNGLHGPIKSPVYEHSPSFQVKRRCFCCSADGLSVGMKGKAVIAYFPATNSKQRPFWDLFGINSSVQGHYGLCLRLQGYFRSITLHPLREGTLNMINAQSRRKPPETQSFSADRSAEEAASRHE